MMGGFSLWHWIIVLLFLISAWPAWRISERAGFAGAWGLLIALPLVNLIVLWLFAFSRWPIDRRTEGKAA